MGGTLQKRVGELDFLKCVFILLMIVFHLVYIGDKYPTVKDFVYTFHIPAFLLLSGYLMNVEKSVMSFLRSMFWIFVPYMIMESGYVFMSSLLPVRERVDHFTVQLLVDKIFFSPMGPYWYLHTLLISGICYFIIVKLLGSLINLFPLLITLSLAFVGLSYGLHLVAPSSALYFVIGIVIKQTGVNFTSFFRGSLWALIPFCLLGFFPDNFDRFTIAGVLLTYLAISVALAVYYLLPSFVRKAGCYIGQHTLLLLLFSPLFTISVKPLVSVFSFDSSGMLFTFVSLLVTVCGSFLITWLMDKSGISRFFFGRDQALQPY